MVTTQQRREAVETLHTQGVSVRHGCVLSRISRNAVGYVSRRPLDDALVAAINEARRKAHVLWLPPHPRASRVG